MALSLRQAPVEIRGSAKPLPLMLFLFFPEVHMYSKFTLITAATALLVAGSAFAEDRGVPGVDVNASGSASTNLKAPLADKNSDGKITRSEASSNPELSKQFSKLDTNKDGSLDMAEYAKFEAKDKPGVMSNEGDEAPNKNNVPGTTDDSTPGNKDLPGPRR
jgi:hypothetical protein